MLKIFNKNKMLMALMLGLGIGGLASYSSFNEIFTIKVYASNPKSNLQEIKAEKNAGVFIQKVGENLFGVLKEKSSEIKKNPNLLKDIVRKELMPFVHTQYTGSMILASYYKQFSNEEKDQFFKHLEGYLVSSYAQIFTLYDNQTIKYIPVKDGNKQLTKAKIEVYQKGNPTPITIQFSLRENKKTNEWQVYDIVSEGLSFVQTKQQEWYKYFMKKDLKSLNQELIKISKQDIIYNKK